MRSLLRCLAFLTLLGSACATVPNSPSFPKIPIEVSREKLAKISKKKVQLWVVVHIRAHKTLGPDGHVDEVKLTEGAVKDADAVVNGGGDAIILINSRCEMAMYERVIAAVRERHPTFPLGISALSYGPSNLVEGFRLAKKFGAQIVWTETVPGERMEYEDDDGTYKPADVIPIELALGTQARELPTAIHASGVHMKYTRPVDGRSFPQAVAESVGLVDAINVTGPKTGTLAEVEKIQIARKAAGTAILGLASGVSVDNISQVIGLIDYAIVGTSLKDPNDELRTSEARVRALRAKMDELSEAAQ